MSYKGSSGGFSRPNAYGSAEEESLYVDKNSVVHYDGAPKLAEEYEERVMNGQAMRPSSRMRCMVGHGHFVIENLKSVEPSC